MLDASFSYAVEEALAKGVTGSTNPFFGDAGLTQLGGGAVSAQAGLNYLENAIGQSGRRGVIHATPGTVSAWNFVNLVNRVEGANFLRTANGTLVVSGAGYYNTDPSGKTGGDPAVGQEWAFATGPVVVYTQPGPELEISEYVDRENNEIIYRAERSFVALWDTVTAIRCLDRLDSVMSPKEVRAMAVNCGVSFGLCRVRVTRVDANGNVIAGNNAYVTDAALSISVTPEHRDRHRDLGAQRLRLQDLVLQVPGHLQLVRVRVRGHDARAGAGSLHARRRDDRGRLGRGWSGLPVLARLR